jgi:hypothetical protein
MSDLLSFLVAVASHWVALMSGIVSLLITIVLRIRKVEPRDKIFWSIAALCFLFAFFLTWRDEHTSLIDTKQQLLKEKDQNSPRLSGKIEPVIIVDSGNAKGTQIFINLSILNTGGTSIADSFLLEIKSPDFQFKNSPAEFPKEYTLPIEEKKSNITLHSQDSIEEKTAKAIERGHLVQGWLRFVVDGIKPEIIRRPKTQFTVSFKDVLRQTYSVTYEMPQHPTNP